MSLKLPDDFPLFVRRKQILNSLSNYLLNELCNLICSYDYYFSGVSHTLYKYKKCQKEFLFRGKIISIPKDLIAIVTVDQTIKILNPLTDYAFRKVIQIDNLEEWFIFLPFNKSLIFVKSNNAGKLMALDILTDQISVLCDLGELLNEKNLLYINYTITHCKIVDDERLVLVAEYSSTYLIIIWNLKSNHCDLIVASDSAIYTLEVLAKQRLVTTGYSKCYGWYIRIWDITNGKYFDTRHNFYQTVKCTAMDDTIITCSLDGIIETLCVNTHSKNIERNHKFRLHTSRIRKIAVLPDGNLAISSRRGIIWNYTINGSTINTFTTKGNYIEDLIVLPNGLVVSYEQNRTCDFSTIKIWG